MEKIFGDAMDGFMAIFEEKFGILQIHLITF